MNDEKLNLSYQSALLLSTNNNNNNNIRIDNNINTNDVKHTIDNQLKHFQ